MLTIKVHHVVPAIEVHATHAHEHTHNIGEETRAFLRELFGQPRRESSFTRLSFPARGITVRGRITDMNITLKRNEPFEAEVQFFDEVGDPAVVESTRWESSIPGVVITVDPDNPLKATGTADSVDSDAIIKVIADADLNPEVTTTLELAGTVFTRHDTTAVVNEINFRSTATPPAE